MKKRTLKELSGTANAIHYIEGLDDNTTVLTHSVNGMTHYIITETTITDEEAKQLRIKELEQQLEECNAKYEQQITRCELSIYECKAQMNFEVSYYWQRRRDHLIEEYNEEQRKLTKELDKLNQSC